MRRRSSSLFQQAAFCLPPIYYCLLFHSFPGFSLPSIPQAQYPGIKLRLVEMTDSFDDAFLRRALRGQLPGVNQQSVLDLAQWFYARSIPCCQRLLAEMALGHLYSCKELPQPTDHNSTIFLHRLIFECIGEKRNARRCCAEGGVKSTPCLQLCDAANQSVDGTKLESGQGSRLMDDCAAEAKMAKEPFLWMLFRCINPNFSRVLQLTQEIKEEEGEGPKGK